MSAETRAIESELSAATSAAKCHRCGCFQDAVAALEASPLRESLAGALAQARARFEQRDYDCLGCPVCWPANALNAAAGLVDLPTAAGCPTETPELRDGWPPRPGEYHVLRYSASVALTTLHSRSLADDVARTRPEGLSIVGPLQTENLGIERVIENVVANPHIRFLVVCGEDTPGEIGHFPGQSLLSLIRDGLDDRGRIVGAQGRRPVLRNLARSLVERFREQVEALDHRGEGHVETITELVRKAAARTPGALAPIDATAPSVRVVTAQASGRLTLDPQGYVVIVPDRRRGLLVAEHYDNGGALRCVVEGTEPDTLMATLIREGAVSRLDHAAYLSRELVAARDALAHGAGYVQDRAPGTAPSAADCGCGPACGDAP